MHTFVVFLAQLNSWISEKLHAVAEDSYKDPRNLESKLKKHTEFCAEITVHQKTINDVKTIGDQLVKNEHYARDDIVQRLAYVENRWQELLHSSSVKSRRLTEAKDRMKFNQKADNLEMLLKDKVHGRPSCFQRASILNMSSPSFSFQELIIFSEDTGNDYEECLIFNKKCAEFEQEIKVESEQIEELKILANELVSCVHSGIPENVHERLKVLTERWERLSELTFRRKELLVKALQVFSFLKSCDEFLYNIHEKVE